MGTASGAFLADARVVLGGRDAPRADRRLRKAMPAGLRRRSGLIWRSFGMVAVVALAGACSEDEGAGRSAEKAPAEVNGSGDPAVSSAVTIENFQFEPDELTVKAGAEVAVTNDDDVAHTLTAMDKSFDSGNLAAGGKGAITVPVGEHPYICSIHPFMKGVLRAET